MNEVEKLKSENNELRSRLENCREREAQLRNNEDKLLAEVTQLKEGLSGKR